MINPQISGLMYGFVKSAIAKPLMRYFLDTQVERLERLYEETLKEKSQ